jgi:hypothetical protein
MVNAHSKSSVKMEVLEKKITATHRVQEHALLKRLEHFCKRAGLEFPTDAWPKDDRKAYFLLGVCATEDMKDLGFRERLARLDDWARQRDLLKPNGGRASKQTKPRQRYS